MNRAIRLQKFSYRFAVQVLNSKLALKQEIEDVLMDSSIDIASLSRPHFKSAIQVPIYVIGIDL